MHVVCGWGGGSIGRSSIEFSSLQFCLTLPSTPVQWELLCSRSYLARLPQSALFLGTSMSNFVAGPFGDKYGRRALLSWSVVFLVACSVLSALSIGLVTYVLSRFLVGFALQGVTLGQSVWSFELTGPDYRSQVQAYGSFISLLGMAALTAVSVVVHNWRLLLVLSACITCIPLLFVRWVDPCAQKDTY